MRMNSVLKAIVVFIVIFPSSASAFTFSGQSRTYLQSRETVTGDNLLPLYEYLDLHADGTNLSFHFAGWARTDLEGRTFDKKTNNELQYAYMSYRDRKSNAMIKAGRTYVFEGVASEQIDGLHAGTDLVGGFRVAAFAGSPVETDFDNRGGDSIYGGRVSHQVIGRYILGISYLKEKNDSRNFREEEGLDLWLKPLTKLELQGRSSYNAETEGWMLHNYHVIMGPFDKLRLNAEASKVNYRDFFHNATVSAFTFPTIDPNESVMSLGGGVEYAVTRTVSAIVDYKSYDYDIMGNADYYGGRLTYASAGSGGAGIAYHRMDGDADKNKYDEYRVYAFLKKAKADMSVDGLYVAYDLPINGVKNAYSISGSVGYAVFDNARAAVDVEYGHNPDFDTEVRAMAKIIYTFGKPSR